jgi:hypothetical protein
MSRSIRVLFVLVLLAAGISPMAAQAAPEAPALPLTCATPFVRPDLETYLICLPPAQMWNGDLVVFAHGYVFANPADTIPYMPYEQITLTVGSSTIALPTLLNGLGFGFAMTSYHKEGLAVLEGAADIRNLVDYVRGLVALSGGRVKHVYVVGASEGGLITTLLMERYPQEFNAGLSLCGPVGNFQKQINYWGDFRAILDALFPGVLPPDAVTIPPGLMADWALPLESSTYQHAVQTALGNTVYAGALIKVTKAAIDPVDPATTIPQTVKGLLDYNIFATTEGKNELGLQPYGNTTTNYSGSGSLALDAAINASITRYPASPGVATALAPYQTTGVLKRPLVNMHTTLDPIVPVWHQGLYLSKVINSHSWFEYSSIAVNRYGHCNFKTSEMLYSFFLMLFKASLQPVNLKSMQPAIQAMVPDNGATYQELLDLNQTNVDLTTSQTSFLPLLMH